MSKSQATPKKILIAVDGSENSNRALEYGLNLASSLKSKVVFVYAIDIPASAHFNMYTYRVPRYSALLGELEDVGKEILANCEKKAKEKGVSFKSCLVSGDPAYKILETRKEEDCDCVVLGKRGLGRLASILMGSVSDKIAKLSPVPVVIVK